MNIEGGLVHGANLAAKRKSRHYASIEQQALLDDLEEAYAIWKQRNLELKGTTDAVIEQRVAWLNEYKDFADTGRFATAFDSRSRLHSSILEEFLLYLFKDSVPLIEKDPVLGGGKAYSALHFEPSTSASCSTTLYPSLNQKIKTF